MKSFKTLQVLFFCITFLIGIIFTSVWLNKQSEKKEPEIFYCGNAVELTGFKSEYTTGEMLFKENCKSCHKIHEDAVGPALFGVTERRPKKWIYAFIKNPAVLIKKKDTMAVNMYNKYNKAEMMSFPSLTTAEIDSILIYIEHVPYPKQLPNMVMPSE